MGALDGSVGGFIAAPEIIQIIKNLWAKPRKKKSLVRLFFYWNMIHE